MSSVSHVPCSGLLPSGPAALSSTTYPASNTIHQNSGHDTRDREETISFPTYDDHDDYGQFDEIAQPTGSPPGSFFFTSYATPPRSLSRPSSPVPIDRAEDDTSIHGVPTKHVDYLTHCWHEEELSNTWKHLKFRKRSYNNIARLENASWRLWVKTKSRLKTIPPETINWLKEHDVTWLYGPLLNSDTACLRSCGTLKPSKRVKAISSDVSTRRPSLRKRSISEIFLRQSGCSSSSLLKEVEDAVTQPRQTAINRTWDVDTTTSPGQLSTQVLDQSSIQVPDSVSALFTSEPKEIKKVIRFNDEVEQFIALAPDNDEQCDSDSFDADSESDDSGIFMQKISTKRRLPPNIAIWRSRKRDLPKSTKTTTSIAKLPPTILKSESESGQTCMKHSRGAQNIKSDLGTTLVYMDDNSAEYMGEWSDIVSNDIGDYAIVDELQESLVISSMSPVVPSSDKLLDSRKVPRWMSQGKLEPENVTGFVLDITGKTNHEAVDPSTCYEVNNVDLQGHIANHKLGFKDRGKTLNDGGFSEAVATELCGLSDDEDEFNDSDSSGSERAWSRSLG
ncbi:protein phosphatase type 1 complex subunit Hex2/Reg1 [Phlyctema vagabunda]|uniref:Protein phosphatase type 1 complex subunit Hex2/Reg1 n=1 Tax=Phlyctema vagabunda TaxID=108571 RepID=A0ABR4PVQ6_9HELO